jgi:mannosyltransferase
MKLGDDPATVRVLSALCSTATIPVIYLLGRRLAGTRVGLLAASILAISPFHVHFAQETRMYALLVLNAALALYALARLLTDPRSARLRLGRQLADGYRAWRTTCRLPPLRAIETDLAWLGYVLFTAATLWSHNTAVFFPVATNLLVATLLVKKPSTHAADGSPALGPGPEPQFLRNWLLAQAGVLLVWSPWLPALAVQGMGVYREFWIPAPTWETVASTVGNLVSEFLPLRAPWAFGVWGFYAALALLGLAHLRHHRARVPFVLVTLVTPFVGEWLVSLRRAIFYDRTLIWASVPLYLLLAAGVRQLRHWAPMLVAVLTMLAANGLSLHQYYAHFQKEQWDDAAAFVAQRVEPDDLILFNATWAQIPFDYYFRPHTQPVAEHGLPVDLFDRGTLEPKMAAGDLPRLQALVQDHQRVWLVYSHAWYTDPQGLILPALAAELDPRGLWDFYGVQVRLYERQ